MALILGIESTCDETAASVVVDGYEVRSNVVASQAEIHARYRGVVPEIASRAHLENLLPVVREALEEGGVELGGLDAIAVAHRPGLIGSLLIGVTAAKTLAWSLGKPLIGVDHVHAHLYSVMLREISPLPVLRERDRVRVEATGEQSPRNGPSPQPSPSALRALPSPGVPGEGNVPPTFPALGLVVSGGHTALYRLGSFSDVELIGSTIDDAVGEAYDKVAAILGLGYPGGPIIDELARGGDPEAIRFPRTLLGRESLDFSFSGLKTAVLYHVRGFQGRQRGPEALSEQEKADVAASFQAACVDVILRKLQRGVQRVSAKSIIVGGGVSANRGLRAALGGFPLPVLMPPLRYCTDNAAMTAGLADLAYRDGRFSALDLDAVTYSQFRR